MGIQPNPSVTGQSELSPNPTDKLIFNLVLQHPVCSFHAIRDFVINATGSKMISTEDLMESVSRVCRSIQGRYVLKRTNDPIIDPFRDIVLSIFSNQTEVDVVELEEQFISQLGRKLSSNLLVQMLNQFAEPQGQRKWTLKQSI